MSRPLSTLPFHSHEAACPKHGDNTAAAHDVVCNQSRKSNLCGDVFITCVGASTLAEQDWSVSAYCQSARCSAFATESERSIKQIGQRPKRAEICIVKPTSASAAAGGGAYKS